jgi:hypothetical protein
MAALTLSIRPIIVAVAVMLEHPQAALSLRSLASLRAEGYRIVPLRVSVDRSIGLLGKCSPRTSQHREPSALAIVAFETRPA